jgi:NADH-quinone oxidoreductase subunit A
MERAYVPVLLLLGFVVFNAVLMLGLSALTLRARPTPVKQTAYESGIPPLGDARERFSVKFYMVAMLFILFDVEAVFLYPWAIILKSLKAHGQALFGISEMFVYIGIVLVGFWYIWKKGVLDWGLTISSPQAARLRRSNRKVAPPSGREPELVGVAGEGDA